MRPSLWLIALVIFYTLASLHVTAQDSPPLTAVPFEDVAIDDAFWRPRLDIIRANTLPLVFAQCEETGRIDNFAKAGGLAEGEYEGYYFNDSDVYKALEGAAYLYALEPDPELDAMMDAVIAKIAAAQEENGYINSFYTLTAPDKKWTDLAVKHELYCGGHLIEAGIAHFKATGKRTLLDVAVRFAELIDEIFGPEARCDVPGHEEIELALIKLFHHTGERRWLDLARFFIESRGRSDKRKIYGEYCQDHVPVAEQKEIAGHAVRAMYLYAAVTDLVMAGMPGSSKLAVDYIATLDNIWRDVTERRMYVTGGIGPSASNEGFTTAYDLPNDTAYAETCASIGLAMWSHRMNLLHSDARYADVMERVLYNGALSGVSLDGREFYYTNPLGSRGNRHRRPWYNCACCPPNILRFFASVGGLVYARSGEAVFVNLYVGGKASMRINNTGVTLTQKTRYPWEGLVRFELGIKSEDGTAGLFTLALRIPEWCEAASVSVNGEPFPFEGLHSGYVPIRREWRNGDVVELELPMPVRRVVAHPKVAQNRGRTALQRGPLVYCLEGADNGGRVRHLVLPRDAALAAVHYPELLGGVTAVSGRALAVEHRDWEGRLYGCDARVDPVKFIAVPYYTWANRGKGEMVVWLPESPSLVELPPLSGVTPSASHCSSGDTVRALIDRREPSGSADHSIPRFTWWPRKGTAEWVQLDFDDERRVAGVSVYWFDDSVRGGGCKPPASWKLLYREGETWKPVPRADGFSVDTDGYNNVAFPAVKTTGLRIEAQLEEGFSAGILEWKVDFVK